MLNWMSNAVRNIFNHEPVKLAIVRKYADANGAYVGELYKYETVTHKLASVTSYHMIGASLDTLPLYVTANECKLGYWKLDTTNDFLAPIGRGTIRIGALTPKDNDAVRYELDKVWRHRIRLTVQNRFIERVLGL